MIKLGDFKRYFLWRGGGGSQGGCVSSARVSSHLSLFSLLNHYQRLGRYSLIQAISVCAAPKGMVFQPFGLKQGTKLTILVLNRVWFVHAVLNWVCVLEEATSSLLGDTNRSEIGLKQGRENHRFWSEIGKGFQEACTPPPNCTPPPSPEPKVLTINFLLEEALQHQVYKNAKTHNVYHRCSPLFVFYF